MPVYEYTCASCGKTFDFLARRVLEAPERCPSCGGRKLSKELSVFTASVNATAPASPCEAAGCSASRCDSGKCPFGG